MNKSKFLKKSLAMILAVMMVVAMIPLSASAAGTTEFVNDGAVLSVGSTTGTLTREGKVFTNTLAYDASVADTLNITLLGDYVNVYYAADDDEFDFATVATDVANISVANGTKKVSFYAVKQDFVDADGEEGTKTELYTVNYVQPAASTSVAVASAKLAGTYDGVVNNAKKTITFTVPWGYDTSSSAAKGVVITLENPVTGAATVSTTIDGTIGTDATVNLTSQHGNTDVYTLVTKEAECVSAIYVGGVKAVQTVDAAGEPVVDSYTVTFPAGTDLSAEDQEIKWTAVNNGSLKIASATFDLATAGSPAAVTNGKKVTVTEDTYELEFTSNATTATTKTYTVKVEVAKSTAAEITAFTATAAVSLPTSSSINVTENGTINGDKLAVTLAKNADITDVKLDITASTGATVTVTAAAGTTPGNYNLTNPAIVKVTAADTTTVKYYQLTATKATAVVGSPAINTAKMTIGTTEYTGTVAGNVITFANLPYATADAAITGTTSPAAAGATFAWTKTAATEIGDIAYDTNSKGNIFEGTNTVVATAENGEKVTYTVKFVKAAAKTGKAVNSFTFTTAETAEDVDATNSWTVNFNTTKKEATVKLPYSFKAKSAATNLAPIFTVSDGAVVYTNDISGTKADLGAKVESGYNDTTPFAAKNTFTVADLTDTNTRIVVANEAAAYDIENATTVTIADLATSTYKKNVTVYTVKVEFATAKTGAKLESFTANDGEVTSNITGITDIEITVPASYVGTTSEEFYADITASELATVTGDSKDLVVDDKTTAGQKGELKVVETASGSGEYELKVNDGSAGWSTVSKIVVTAEDGVHKNEYDVTVKVAAAKTGADLTSFTADGVKATVNAAAKTATVTLPFGTDLTKVEIGFEVSELATPVLSNGTKTDDKWFCDLSEPMTITITSEDKNTVKVYTVTATVASQFTDVPATAWYAETVYAAANAEIIKGFPNGTFQPTGKITRADFAIMIARLLKADTSKYTTVAFKDVPNTHYAVGAIAWCAEKKIVTGIGENFEPKRTITREEAATMMARALELTSTATTTNFKDDAAIQNYAKASVAACAAAGIMTGDNGSFRPADTLTRAEAAQIMVNVLNK